MGVTWALHTNTHKFYRSLKGQHCPMTWRISCDGLLNMMMIFRSNLAAFGLKSNWMISPLSWVSYISHQVNLDWRILLQTIAERISFGICFFTQEPQKRAARNYINTSMDRLDMYPSLPTNLYNRKTQSEAAISSCCDQVQSLKHGAEPQQESDVPFLSHLWNFTSSKGFMKVHPFSGSRKI